MAKQQVKLQQIKQQSAGAYFTAIVDKKKYTIKPTEEERTLVKKEISSYNVKPSEARLKKILLLLKPKEEKKKQELLVTKKVLHKKEKEAKETIKEAKKELSQFSLDSNLDEESHKVLSKNKLFLIKDGSAYLLPFKEVRLPKTLVNRFVEFIKDNVNLDPLINFWKLALLNPNEVARTKLFDYLSRQNMTITPKGYIVTYRMVKKTERFTKDGKPIYTSAHKGQEEYIMGTAFKLDRKDCDEDGGRDCSKGLHTGTHRFIGILTDKKVGDFVEGTNGVGDGYGTGVRITTKQETNDSYGTGYDRPKSNSTSQTFNNSFGNQAVICLVNPMHVVSIPNSDTRKMRSCELFFCGTTTPEEVVDLVEKDYHIFDHQYYEYELEQINQMLKDSKLKEYIDNEKTAKTLKKKEQAEALLIEVKSKLAIRNDNLNTNQLSMEEVHNIIKSRIVKPKLLK